MARSSRAPYGWAEASAIEAMPLPLGQERCEAAGPRLEHQGRHVAGIHKPGQEERCAARCRQVGDTGSRVLHAQLSKPSEEVPFIITTRVTEVSQGTRITA